MTDQAITHEQVKTLVSLLGKLKPGFLPYDVFIEVARLVVLPIIEVVPLRLNAENKIEVLLLSRSKDDPIWPGMVHSPGTVIRADDTDESTHKAFLRITHDELADTEVSDPYYVGSILHKSRRGMEQSQVFWVEVTGAPTIGQFYALDNLPDNLIESQTKFIHEAARSFLADKS